MQTIINRILKQHEEMQKTSLRYFTRCPPDIRVLILSNKTPLFHKIRQEHGDADKAVLEYCAMILSIQEQQNKEKKLSRKSFSDLTPVEIDQLTDLEISKFMSKQKKRGQKGDFLLSRWAEVRRLRLTKNMSFKEIAEYFTQKYRGFNISKSKVQSMWTQLEKDANNG
jgi:hypothetical protein